ncbi:Uncharacterised protein [Mycobacteroides abscessus subsp. abscessus]|nr:Uncharacterised protein [Mycobacteroides abscessus subsp. abscessus]
MDELRGGELDAVAGGDARRMQRGVLLGDGDSRLVAMLRHTGGHGHQPAAEQLIADLPLLIPGVDSGVVRGHPHLDEAHRIGMPLAGQPPRVVLF